MLKPAGTHHRNCLVNNSPVRLLTPRYVWTNHLNPYDRGSPPRQPMRPHASSIGSCGDGVPCSRTRGWVRLGGAGVTDTGAVAAARARAVERAEWRAAGGASSRAVVCIVAIPTQAASESEL